MTEQQLTDMLERAGERTYVGSPPLERMLARAHRVRRRHTALLAAVGAAAVVAVVSGTAAIYGPESNPRRDPAASAATSPTSTIGSSSTNTVLTGTWTVRDLTGANGQSVLPASHVGKVQVTFKNSELTGTTGCNDVFGRYEQGGDGGQDLAFPRSELGSTLVGCRDEPPLVPRLLDVRHVSGSGDIRYLHAANWTIVAKLQLR